MAQKFGQKLKGELSTRPKLQLDLTLYYNAFMSLSSCRTIGASVGSIPWTSIKDYGVFYRFNEQQLEDLFFYIPALDAEYLKWASKE